MHDGQQPADEGHEHADHLLSAAATLTGTCLAAAALIRVEQAALNRALLWDTILAGSALGFLVATIVGYCALRCRSRWLRTLGEVAFGIGGVLLIVVLVAMVFEAVPT